MFGNTPPTKKSKPSAATPKPKLKPKPVLPKKTYRSEERVVESSDEGEGVASASMYETTTGNSESESESESESGSGSEDGSSTEQGSESDGEEEESPPPVKDSDITKYKYTYVPPPAFKPIPPPSSSDNPFSARNLEGKEIWFITAPLAAPLSKLTDVNPADIAEGMPVLETGSRRYCLRAQEDNEELTGVSLVVQDGKSGGYKMASKQITSSFKLVEELPEPTAPLNQIPKSKPIREQPDGLWMRFKPIGYVGAQDEDANVETVDVDVRLSREDANGKHRKKKRKLYKEGVDSGSAKKEKKHRSKEKHRRKSAIEAS